MTTPTREQVVQWMEHSGIRAFDTQIVCKVGNLVSLARADLEATVKEQAAEIERLMVMSATEAAATIPSVGEYIAQIEQHLAAAQLHIEQLREVIQTAADQIRKCDYTPARSTLLVSLSTQPDLSAIEAERQRVAEACAKVCDQQKDECGTGTDSWYGAKWCEEDIRAGQWREHL